MNDQTKHQIEFEVMQGLGQIRLDGRDVQHVRTMSITSIAGAPAKVHLELECLTSKASAEGTVSRVDVCPLCDARFRDGDVIPSGQAAAAYEAYRERASYREGLAPLAPWGDLPNDEQERWEAVARAVVAIGTGWIGPR